MASGRQSAMSSYKNGVSYIKRGTEQMVSGSNAKSLLRKAHKYFVIAESILRKEITSLSETYTKEHAQISKMNKTLHTLICKHANCREEMESTQNDEDHEKSTYQEAQAEVQRKVNSHRNTKWMMISLGAMSLISPIAVFLVPALLTSNVLDDLAKDIHLAESRLNESHRDLQKLREEKMTLYAEEDDIEDQIHGINGEIKRSQMKCDRLKGNLQKQETFLSLLRKALAKSGLLYNYARCDMSHLYEQLKKLLKCLHRINDCMSLSIELPSLK